MCCFIWGIQAWAEIALASVVFGAAPSGVKALLSDSRESRCQDMGVLIPVVKIPAAYGHEWFRRQKQCKVSCQP